MGIEYKMLFLLGVVYVLVPSLERQTKLLDTFFIDPKTSSIKAFLYILKNLPTNYF